MNTIILTSLLGAVLATTASAGSDIRELRPHRFDHHGARLRRRSLRRSSHPESNPRRHANGTFEPTSKRSFGVRHGSRLMPRNYRKPAP